ncbi:MAG TPA: TolC family protein [Rhizomicrobium sp.]|jgi:NodT family efflux transporter outer membrane factor (OMF) lipoprotein
MNKTPAFLALPLVGVLLAGCSTPVPQSLPPQMLPKAFTGPEVDNAPVWPEASWWKGFQDDELASLIADAQTGNRDLAVAAAHVMEAEAQTTIARSALFPQVNGGAGHVNSGCSGQSCQDFGNQKAFNLTFNASYELDVWGLAQDNLRAAKEQVKSTRFAEQAVALALNANVADQYLNVLALRQRIAIADEYIVAINDILAVINLRVKTGSISHLDLAREQAQLEFEEAQLPALQTQEKRALYILAVILGRPPEGFDVKAQNLDAVQSPLVGPGLPSELLLRRPDVAQAEANLASAHANVDAARAAFLPQISLTGSGGFVSTAFGTLLQGSNFGYAYGANLLQTIFDGGKLAGQKDLADATEQDFVAQYQSAALNAYADVETALIQVANNQKAEDHLRREVEAAKEAFEITQLQYRQGATDLLNVLQAQQQLFGAEDQLAQTIQASRQASVHLYEALGGGWVEKPEERTQFVQNETDKR